MRDDLIESAVRFLQHVSVQHTPLSERITFLERKGLTKEETEEALRRYHSAASQNVQFSEQNTHSSEQIYAQEPLHSAVSLSAAALPILYKQRQQRRPGFLANVAYSLAATASLIGAISMLFYAWKLAVQLGYLPRKWSLSNLFSIALESDSNASKTDLSAVREELEAITQVIQKHTVKMTELCQTLENQSIQETETRDIHSRLSHDVLAEVSAMRAQLCALQGLDADAQTIHRDISCDREITDNRSEEEANAMEATRIELVLTALSNVERENDIKTIQEASSLLTMYVKNLIDNPDVPRYRKIAPGNINYKNKIVPMKHHRELLEAIGFKSNGMNLEYKVEDKENCMAVLHAFHEALQSVHDTDSDSHKTLCDITKSAYDKEKLQQIEESTVSSLKNSTSSNVGAEDDIALGDNLQDFFRKLEMKSSKTAERFPTESDEDPLHSQQSLTDIIKLVESGQEVPGIQHIEEKLSVDSSKYLEEMRQTNADISLEICKPSIA